MSPVFEKPPLIEVALSVQFRQKPNFVGAHAGLFWERIKAPYAVAQEHPRLGPIDEVFGTNQMSTIQFHAGFSGNRHWFLTNDGSSLVQLQKDRLALNWRRLTTNDVYPRFEALSQEFDRLFELLDGFFVELHMDQCEVNMCEVTYINQWFFESGEKFSDAVRDWLTLAPSHSASLEMETASIAARYLVSLDGGTPIGRLYVNVSPISSNTGAQGVNLEITCRVRPTAAERQHVHGLALAHEKAVTTFQEITSDEAQQKWRG
ncbi:TIGR04255 family protein [Aestuariivirga sp.]|uniref:TIGR04255 family protein n=1 Tax=Aestuariivirga sp. TaxID=2650926 RepID=UPI0025BB4121|nr:TIGR04255 family protein [Aestuariivirga sp.]MCA3556109.1 TIGR04255 family protein [Aestuariivirga sp.]